MRNVSAVVFQAGTAAGPLQAISHESRPKKLPTASYRHDLQRSGRARTATGRRWWTSPGRVKLADAGGAWPAWGISDMSTERIGPTTTAEPGQASDRCPMRTRQRPIRPAGEAAAWTTELVPRNRITAGRKSVAPSGSTQQYVELRRNSSGQPRGSNGLRRVPADENPAAPGRGQRGLAP